MATGVQGKVKLVNGNGTSESGYVYNNQASSLQELEHEYVALRYTLTIKVG